MKTAKPPIPLGPIEGLLLLGGGPLLRKLCLWAKSKSLSVKVVTAPRHGEESLNGLTLVEFCEKNEIAYCVIEKLSDKMLPQFLANCERFFFLSLGSAWIFKEKEIEGLFAGRLFNLHGSRLPQNRGAGGFSWLIMTGNRFGLCVLHQVDGGIDTGDIVAFEEFLYPASARTPSDYQDIYSSRNLDFIAAFICSHLESEQHLEPIKQSEWFATYWPRLNTDLNGYIDWSLNPLQIERFICAFDNPYKGASTFLNGNKVLLKKVSLSAQDGVFHPFQRGIIYRKSGEWLCVALEEGFSLIVESVCDEDGESLLAEIRIGDRFITPSALLESALERVSYTPSGVEIAP